MLEIRFARNHQVEGTMVIWIHLQARASKLEAPSWNRLDTFA